MKGPEGCDVLAWKKGRAVLSLTLNMAGIGQGGSKTDYNQSAKEMRSDKGLETWLWIKSCSQRIP